MSTVAITPEIKRHILDVEYQSHFEMDQRRPAGVLKAKFAEVGPYRLMSTNTPADFVNRVTGLFDATVFDDIPLISDWFFSQGKDVIFAIYPGSIDIPTLNRLLDSGFRVSSYMTYWFYFLDDFTGRADPNVIKIGPDLCDTFVTVGMEAVATPSEDPFYPISEDLFRRYCEVDNSDNFLYYAGDHPVGTGASHYVKDTAIFLNGAVIPSYRGQQIQQRVITTRLAYAKEAGLKYAVTSTDLDSTSGRNMERLGFQKAFTATHLKLVR